MTLNKQKSSLDVLEPLGAAVISVGEIRTMLDSAMMFKDFEWSQIEALSAYIQLYRAVPGTVLFREGDQGDFMCVVLQGRLDILKQDTLHEDKTVATVYAGRSLGEMAMVDSEPRSATALVVQPAVLAVLTQESFAAITHDKPALAVKLLLKIAQLISQRLRHTSGVLVDYLEK
ncbi:MAG: cyclic nucleotide-binding domain-containing protein [Gallionella sp.]|jgi:CRP-like cAMP-binding protein